MTTKQPIPAPKLAIRYKGKTEPIAEELTVKYQLKAGTRTPFTGHEIVAGENERR